MKVFFYRGLLFAFSLFFGLNLYIGCSKTESNPSDAGKKEIPVEKGDAGVKEKKEAQREASHPLEKRALACDRVFPDARSMPMPKAPSPSGLSKLAKSNHKFSSKFFLGSKFCAQCHDGMRTPKGEDISIVKSWSSTMMANAMRDPYYLAKVESEMKRAPHIRGALADKCTRCHAPMASHESKIAGHKISLFKKGFLDPKNAHFDQAMDGVSCTLCHQIEKSPGFGTSAAFSGKFKIGTYSKAVDRKIYGPYDDVVTNLMRNYVKYTPTGSKHISSSALCGTCHNLKTNFLDAKGKVVPKTPEEKFPEQMAYSEWKFSAFPKEKPVRTCQTCHMKSVSGVTASDGPPWIKVRKHFGKHIFVGGSTFMLEMMKNNRELLGIQANNFEFTIKKAREMLSTSVLLRISNKSFSKSKLSFQVRIYNLAGHKLPTGYPSRRVFLQVVVKNSKGAVVFESGKVEKDGRIKGVDSDYNPKSYEPHYDKITRPDQVQVYESIMVNSDKEVTYTLLRAAKYIKDNRILPRGFDKKKAPYDIRVAGCALGDANFTAGVDQVTYEISKLPKDTYTVELALKYQSISYQTALDLFKDREGASVKRFLYLYRKAKDYIETIQSTSFQISGK